MAFDVSTKFAFHPAVMAAGIEASGLWVLTGAWSSSNRENGWVPTEIAQRYDPQMTSVAALVDNGLWTEDLNDGEPGYWITVDPLLCRFREWRATIPLELRWRVYERDGYACVRCQSEEDLTLDHIYPWIRGGPDTYENFQTMCRPCNSRKGARVGA